jgi:dihydropteroate synthase
VNVTATREARGDRDERVGPATRWELRGVTISLDRPVIAGVLNVTPDSFSDGGVHFEPGRAIDRAFEMVEEGAGLIDVGAESNRPGDDDVAAATEWARLEPVLEGLRDLPVPLSVYTMKIEVAERALDAGAAAINDVSGGRSAGLVDLVAREGAGVVLMHMRGNPRTMQTDTRYDDVVSEVSASLGAARDAAVVAGCDASTIALDPGIGFGKALEGNLELMARLDEIVALGSPVWIGPSRKSFLGELLGTPAEERVEGTIAACVASLMRGARVFRVHDVEPVGRALAVAWAVMAAGAERDKRGRT